MGYDVSFHPISPEEMREWYFTPLTWIQQGQEEKVLALAAQHGMEDFYAEKYLNSYQGGNNAGHTVVTTQGKFVLNLLPSGILHPGVVCVLGDGMVVDLEHLSQEIHEIEKKGIRVTPDHLKLSKRATVSMPWHKVHKTF